MRPDFDGNGAPVHSRHGHGDPHGPAGTLFEQHTRIFIVSGLGSADAALVTCQRGCLPGLIEDTEEKELKGLVEERVKALHFRAPQVLLCSIVVAPVAHWPVCALTWR